MLVLILLGILWWTQKRSSQSAEYWHEQSANSEKRAAAALLLADRYHKEADQAIRETAVLRHQLDKMPKPVIYIPPTKDDAESILESKGIKLAEGSAVKVATAIMNAEQVPLFESRAKVMEDIIATQETAIVNLQLETGSLLQGVHDLKNALEASRNETKAVKADCKKKNALFGGGGLIAGMLLVLVL